MFASRNEYILFVCAVASIGPYTSAYQIVEHAKRLADVAEEYGIAPWLDKKVQEKTWGADANPIEDVQKMMERKEDELKKHGW